MLVECGLTEIDGEDGQKFAFYPSFSRIASLGSPHEIIGLYARLHGPSAAKEAAFILVSLSDQEDLSGLIGWRDEGGLWHQGSVPASLQVIFARQLMLHGIVGKARPDKGDGKYSDKFDAAEYISAARVHLGLSSADAGALSMTEYQSMMEMKFPDAKNKQRDVPSREEYSAAMKAIKERKRV